MVTGKTVGGTVLYPQSNRLDRTEALRRYTSGSAWFSGDEEKKGTIAVGRLADLAVLSADYFSVPDEEIKQIESQLTVVDGKVVYGVGDFRSLAPSALAVSPDWSPVKSVGGYYATQPERSPMLHQSAAPGRLHQLLDCLGWSGGELKPKAGGYGLACDCFVF
jgi:hypothetical protein